MKCKKCGSNIPKKSKFCTKCGHPLTNWQKYWKVYMAIIIVVAVAIYADQVSNNREAENTNSASPNSNPPIENTLTPTPTTEKISTITPTNTPSPTFEQEENNTLDVSPTAKPTQEESTVWISQSGKRYHSNPNCSGMENPSKVTQEEAENMGYTPCKKCY